MGVIGGFLAVVIIVSSGCGQATYGLIYIREVPDLIEPGRQGSDLVTLFRDERLVGFFTDGNEVWDDHQLVDVLVPAKQLRSCASPPPLFFLCSWRWQFILLGKVEVVQIRLLLSGLHHCIYHTLG